MLANSGTHGSDEGLRAYVKSVFVQFDTDNSNSIEPEEFHKLCTELGYFFTNDELETIFSIIDVDHSKTVEFEEFYEWWRKSDRFKIHNARKLQLYRAALNQFRQYDLDGNGQISMDEYKQIAKAGNWGKTDAELEEMMGKLDTDGDGEISFDEYVAWLNWGL